MTASSSPPFGSIQATYATVPRSLASLLGDQGYNLKSLGALLDGSGGDNTTIQSIYNSAASGSVLMVPSGSLWTGTITSPNNVKALTYLALGENAFSASAAAGLFAGDNDLTVTFTGGTAAFNKNSLNSSTPPTPPLTATYNNYSPNYVGAFSYNYAQYVAAQFQGNSGPMANGNTAAMQCFFNSYGMNPAGSYDILYNGAMAKIGQTSTWLLNLFHTDSTGRLPGAFASWSEIIYEANGWDALPGSAAYYASGVNNRVGLDMSFLTYPQTPWGAGLPVYAKGTTQFSLQAASTIAYTASDSNSYVWVCAQSGTTGGTSPAFPVPTLLMGVLFSTGLLVVTSKTSGPNLAPNAYLSIGTQLNACKVLSDGTGTGAAGTYNCTAGFGSAPGYTGACTAGVISGYNFTVAGTVIGTFAIGAVLTGNGTQSPVAAGTVITGGTYPNFTVNISQSVSATLIEGFAPSPILAAPNVTDNTAVWAFGTLNNAYFSAGLLISAGANLGTALGINGNIYQAGVDTTGAVFASGAAAIRVASGQLYDFTGNGTQGGQNLRTLGYLGGASGVVFTSLGHNALIIGDSGNLQSLYNTLDDGGGNMSLHGSLAFASTATITSGTSAPASTQPAGSIYLKEGGATGARLYVSAGSGTWNAISGV